MLEREHFYCLFRKPRDLYQEQQQQSKQNNNSLRVDRSRISSNTILRILLSSPSQSLSISYSGKKEKISNNLLWNNEQVKKVNIYSLPDICLILLQDTFNVCFISKNLSLLYLFGLNKGYLNKWHNWTLVVPKLFLHNFGKFFKKPSGS